MCCLNGLQCLLFYHLISCIFHCCYYYHSKTTKGKKHHNLSWQVSGRRENNKGLPYILGVIWYWRGKGDQLKNVTQYVRVLVWPSSGEGLGKNGILIDGKCGSRFFLIYFSGVRGPHTDTYLDNWHIKSSTFQWWMNFKHLLGNWKVNNFQG